MIEAHDRFNDRLRTISRKHNKMADGYKTVVSKDGLIVAVPKRQGRGVPLKFLLALVIGFFAFKAFMLSSLGEASYAQSVAKLEQGSTVEQVGAVAMSMDPVTTLISDFASAILR